MTHSPESPPPVEAGSLMAKLDELEVLIAGADFGRRLETLQMAAWRAGDATLIRTCARARVEAFNVHSPNVLACAMLLRDRGSR